MTVALDSVPKAPGHVPVLGHTGALWRRPLQFLKKLPDTGGLVRVNLGTMPVYFVTSAPLTHEVLVSKARYFEKGRLFDRMQPLVGHGLATAGGETHRKHRRMLQPIFHQQRIAGYVEIMSERAQALCDSFEADQQISVEKVMSTYAIGTLAATMFSTDIAQPAVEVVRRDVPTILRTMLIRAVSPKVLDRLPIGPNRQFDAATARLRQVIDDVITATRNSDTQNQKDLLSMLLDARDADSGEALTDQEVRDELVTMLFAGTETTAATLSWALHEIAHSPEVEQRLLEEIDTVVGQRPVRPEDISELVYTRRVLDEVIRLHGVTLLMRRAMEPVEIGGVTVPEGTEIGLSLYALHYDPENYPDPTRFDPDRHVPETARALPRGAYLPFGGGNRKCIGDGFSWAEITVTLATLLQRWRLRPVPGHTVREVTAAMTGPDHMPMTVVPRER